MAIVVISLMAMLAIIAWTGTHMLGHLAHDKTSLVRATDAAAYSAAVVQARTLNLHAYLNRAQLAHQVAMAHLVTVASAERFRAMQAQQSSRFNPPATVIGMLFGQRHATAYLAARAGNTADAVGLGQLEQAFRRHDAIVHDVLVATRARQLRDLPAVREHEIRKVLARNLGNSGSSLRAESLESLGVKFTQRLDDWPGAIGSLAGDAPASLRLLHAVSRQHGYLNPRDARQRNFWAVSVRCPHKRHELRRRGETSLDRQGHWRSTDTLSFHALRANQTIGCYQREYPMGWAILQADRMDSPAQIAAPAGLPGGHIASDYRSGPAEHATAGVDGEGLPQRFSDQAFWRWVGQQAAPGWDIFNGHDNRLAARWAQSGAIDWATRGRPGFADLRSGNRGPVRIAIEVSQPAQGRLAVRLRPQRATAGVLTGSRVAGGELLTASAAAHTYFSRPHDRADGRLEKASLFHPYWHARLIALPPGDLSASTHRGPRQ